MSAGSTRTWVRAIPFTVPALVAALACAAVASRRAVLAQDTAGATSRVRVSIAARTLTLEVGEQRETFPVSLGAASRDGPKERRGDRRTPRGRYFVARLRAWHPRYHRFALLAYPNPEDAARGVRAGIVGAPIAELVRAAFTARRTPPQDTALGGQIGIHGLGVWSIGEALVGHQDLTDGCIAMRDSDIDRLWPRIRRGTEVVIAE